MNNLNVSKIQLNGYPYEVNYGTNLNDLLNKLKIQKNKVAIEVNGEIVEKGQISAVFKEIEAEEYMRSEKIEIYVDIGTGKATGVLELAKQLLSKLLQSGQMPKSLSMLDVVREVTK